MRCALTATARSATNRAPRRLRLPATRRSFSITPRSVWKRPVSRTVPPTRAWVSTSALSQGDRGCPGTSTMAAPPKSTSPPTIAVCSTTCPVRTTRLRASKTLPTVTLLAISEPSSVVRRRNMAPPIAAPSRPSATSPPLTFELPAPAPGCCATSFAASQSRSPAIWAPRNRAPPRTVTPRRNSAAAMQRSPSIVPTEPPTKLSVASLAPVTLTSSSRQSSKRSGRRISQPVRSSVPTTRKWCRRTPRSCTLWDESRSVAR